MEVDFKSEKYQNRTFVKPFQKNKFDLLFHAFLLECGKCRSASNDFFNIFHHTEECAVNSSFFKSLYKVASR